MPHSENSIPVIGVPGGEDTEMMNGAEVIFKSTIAENFLKLISNIKLQCSMAFLFLIF